MSKNLKKSSKKLARLCNFRHLHHAWDRPGIDIAHIGVNFKAMGLLLILLCLVGCGGGGSSSGEATAQSAPMIQSHTIPVSTVTSLKVTQARYSGLVVVDYPRMGDPQRVCVMEVPVSEPRAGDILMITGEVEVTNDLTYEVEVCRRLSWENGTGGISGMIITPEAGENVTPETHHMLVPFSGVFVVPEDADLRYISLVMYAGGSRFTNEGDSIRVEMNWGHLSVLKFSSE